MPVLREQDFDKLATSAVDKFLSGRSKLADAVAEEATEHGLNPDQIERLTQSANTMTFLKMMDQRKQQGAGDLMHEFDPVDSRHVIRIVIDNAGVHVDPHAGESATSAPPADVMGDHTDELPDEMSGKSPIPPSPAPPAEEKDVPEEDEKKKSTKKAAAMMRARKFASILEDQLKQAEWAFEDRLVEIGARFKKVYNPTSFASFEKDALAEHGDALGLEILDILRDTRGMKHIDKTTAREKTAAMQDHHISDDTPELRLFEEMHKIATQAAKLEEGLAWVKQQCA